MTRLQTVSTLSILALASLAFAFIFKTIWPVYLAAFFLLAGASDNIVGRSIAAGWLKFGEALGRFNSKILLAVIYYLVLTPVAMAYRLFNRPAVDHFIKNPEGSLFSDIEGDPCSKESFEKPW